MWVEGQCYESTRQVTCLASCSSSRSPKRTLKWPILLFMFSSGLYLVRQLWEEKRQKLILSPESDTPYESMTHLHNCITNRTIAEGKWGIKWTKLGRAIEAKAYPDSRGLVLVAVEQLRDLAAHLAHLRLLLVPQQLDPRHGHLEGNLAETPRKTTATARRSISHPRKREREQKKRKSGKQKRSGLTTCRA
jgi:hypothetical protein